MKMKYPKTRNCKPWSYEDTNFLIKNWKILTNIQIGEKINRTDKACSMKGLVLKLGTKNGSGYKRSAAIEDYNMYIKMVEVANKLKVFKENFSLKGNHNFIINNGIGSGNKCKQRLIQGNVISSNKNIVTLQLENYRESFTMSDFFTGEIFIRG